MARITYQIMRSRGGWRIICGAVEGAPYLRKSDAIADAQAVAKLLAKAGEKVEVLAMDEASQQLKPVPVAIPDKVPGSPADQARP